MNPGAAADFSPRTQTAYRELARWLAGQHREQGLRVLGINGAQGSGKSALTRFLVADLHEQHGLRALPLALDDFYLGRAARIALAASVHPLLRTRGVPGTHDVERGMACLRALIDLKPGQCCRLPVFSKADDDVLDAGQERVVDAVPDLILFEGWCVATPAQGEAELAVPVNELERRADPDASWRHYVNRQLAGPYARWFAAIDALVHLAVPGWDQVREWRTQQERETAAAHGGRSGLRTADDLERFIQHYQRLSLHALDRLPQIAAVVVALDAGHDVGAVRYRVAAPLA